MKIPHALLPVIRSLVLLVFVAFCTFLFGYLWLNSGGRLPVISKPSYTISVNFPSAANLVYDSDAMMAGVRVGRVSGVRLEGNQAHVTIQLDREAPLHSGASIQVRNKTLLEETYLEITDGKGKSLRNGSVLPDSAARPNVSLNDVLTSLDPPTRHAFASTVRSLGHGTAGARQNISDVLRGFGALGRTGGDAVSALAAQSNDLKSLTGTTATLLAALDTSQGRIAQLVDDAGKLTESASSGATEIRQVMRQLPGVMGTARNATGGLDQLSAALAPVARNLRAAGPNLDAALRELPETTTDLRGLLPSLNRVVDDSPSTLKRVPAVADDAKRFLPTTNVALTDLNPMLAYFAEYDRDLAAFFANNGQTTARGDKNGTALRYFMIYNEQSLKGYPLGTSVGPLKKNNPYPMPGEGTHPGPFEGTYPRVEKDPPK